MPIFEEKAQIVQFPKFLDERGNLSVVESQKQVPFRFRRCYWIYDVPGGELRGSHAFKNQHEVIVALSGSFDAVIHDGKEADFAAVNTANDICMKADEVRMDSDTAAVCARCHFVKAS